MAQNGAASISGDAIPLLALICVLSVVASAIVVRWMIRLAVMDIPGTRSAHDRPVPRGGGAGMVVAVILGLPAVLLLLPGGNLQMRAALVLEAAVAVLAGVSWLDDMRQLGFQSKLGAQIAAAALAISAVLMATPVLPSLWLTVPGIVLAFCWLLFVTNAMNFIDGLNGLAAGTTALCGLVTMLLGWMMGDPLTVAASLLLTAGLLGFLPFNYPKARIFLGDIGSQVCGLLAGTLALLLGSDAGPAGGFLVVPLVLAGILWDVLFTLCRRARAGERLTQAHRGHLYQFASRAGLPPASIAAIHWGFALWGGVLALGLLPDRPVLAIVLAALPQFVWTALVRHRVMRAGLQR